MQHNDEIFNLFILEAQDNLNKVENALLELENNPKDKEAVAEVKREIHTLKGASRMMGFKNISTMAHSIESLFEKIEGNIELLKKSTVSALFFCIDWLYKAVETLPGVLELPADLEEFFDNLSRGIEISVGKFSSEKVSEEKAEQMPSKKSAHESQESEKQLSALVENESLRENTKEEKQQNLKEKQTVKQAKTDYLTLRFDKIKALLNYSNIFTNYIGRFRYYVDRLSKEELERLSKEEILNVMEQWGSQIAYDLRFYELYAKQFQDQVSSMILVPLALVFDSMPRLVRDVAVSTGKEVDFVMSGKEIEIDKQLVDLIQQSLIHLLRNAVDHGIESPEERRKKGKNPKGKVGLKAYTQLDRVFIEISDDGQGLSAEKIKAKAIAKGLISAEQAEMMNKEEILHLIFKPGFSTKDEVSDFSGRGVGLDVVAETARRFNSEVGIQTEEGKGTTFILSFPINSSVISVTMFEGAGDIYAFPSLNIDQVLFYAEQRINTIEKERMLEYKHSWIPLINVENLLGHQGEVSERKENIIVVSIQNRYYGIAVNRVLGENSVVIKSVSGLSHKIPMLSGVLSLSRRDVMVLNALDLITRYRER